MVPFGVALGNMAVVGGRHDPVLGPRAVAVVEAMAKLVLCDLAMRGGFYDE